MNCFRGCTFLYIEPGRDGQILKSNSICVYWDYPLVKRKLRTKHVRKMRLPERA
jgi:hypothetical protein